MIADVTGVVLAGGKSRRMGQDKRFLELGEQTLFNRSLSIMRSVFSSVLVVIAQDSTPVQTDIPVLRDLVPHCGSLGGLYTGLAQATTDRVFVVACDMPFLDAKAIRFMTTLHPEADVVMPKLDHRLQPMHTVYSKRCLPIIEAMIKEHDLKIQHIVDDSSLLVRTVSESDLLALDPEGRSFLNINTPADLQAARMLLSRKTDFPSS